MKAVGYERFGTPDVLKVMELDKPKTGLNEVRIRVKAAGVLPIDCKVRSGLIPPGAGVKFPIVPGNEFAGIVDQIGENVGDFKIGDEVLGFGVLNSYAEYVVVRSDQIVHKPINMPWEIAGGFSGNGQGAHMALSELGIKEGDSVLIHAAAGGLGTFAVQLARLWGAKTVIGTASRNNHDYLRSLGAVPVQYGEGLAERVLEIAPEGVDAVLDAVGPEALQASIRLVRNNQRIRTMLPSELADRMGIPPLKANRSASRLEELCELYAQGKLHITIRNTYPLDQAAHAQREVESGHGRGKVVLLVSED